MKKIMALVLLAGCLFMFAGCTAQENDFAGTVMSISGLKDIAFSDTVTVNYSDVLLSQPQDGDSSALQSETPLQQDQLKETDAVGNIKTLVYIGSVSASRDQFYLQKTVNYFKGSPDVYQVFINGDIYKLTKNGKTTKTGSIKELTAQISPDLTLLGFDTSKITDCDTASQVVSYLESHYSNILDDLDGVNFSEVAKNSYTFNIKDSNDAQAALGKIIENIVKDTTGKDLLANMLQGLGEKDNAIDVSLTGNFIRNADYTFTSAATLNLSATVPVMAPKTVESSTTETASTDSTNDGSSPEFHKLTLTFANDLLISPMMADAIVDVGSITTNAANLFVTVTPDTTTVSRGIVYSNDPDNTHGTATVEAQPADGKYVVMLTKLKPDTTYYYQGYGVDIAGFTVKGPVKSFKTLAVTSGGTSNPQTGDNGTLLFISTIGGLSMLLLALGVIKKQRRAHS